MLQYVYSAREAGRESWPSGELRLEGFDVTRNPDEADVFVCPGNLSLFQSGGVINRDQLYRLPYLAGRENRHVFFDVSDNFTTALDLPIVFLKCDARDWMLPSDPGTIQQAWPVENYAECVDVPAGGFKFDISGRMWLSTQTRIDACSAIRGNADLKSDIETYDDFTGYIYYEPEGIRRRAEFRRSMRESRVCLCPESIPGVFPYRFFEAMSAGRVPLLVSSDYVFPWSSEIPYSEFCLFCPRENAKEADWIALQFVRSHSDAEIIEMGRRARHYWQKWLNSSDWPRTMGLAVKRKMGFA